MVLCYFVLVNVLVLCDIIGLFLHLKVFFFKWFKIWFVVCIFCSVFVCWFWGFLVIFVVGE